jgi:signal transduction histidine kinase
MCIRDSNKIGTIPVRVEGIQDKSGAALDADPYLAANLVEIERSASQAMHIMRESLFHLRPIHTTPVDVATCVVEAIGAAGLPPAVQVTVQGLETLPAVQADRRRLALVFHNLLENATTAMEAHGVVTIAGSEQPGWVELLVSDTGPGITPELQERIFEFHFSGRQVHAGKLGFGLWWVKTLMNRFGGSVAVQSDGQRGTTFVLRLPRADGAREE